MRRRKLKRKILFYLSCSPTGGITVGRMIVLMQDLFLWRACTFNEVKEAVNELLTEDLIELRGVDFVFDGRPRKAYFLK